MAQRPTLRDVARASGYSLATVNRVARGGENVRGETARQIARAATRIGYHGRNLLERRAEEKRPDIRLGVVLHRESQPFYKAFANEIEAAAARAVSANITTEIAFSPSQAPSDFAAALRGFADRVDAIAATSVSHHSTETALHEISQTGTPCFALLSDFAQDTRVSYIGLNNLKVGRGAASALVKASGGHGKLALFTGGSRWHGHELRETGFRNECRTSAPQMVLLDTFLNLETRQLTYETTLQLLDRHRDLAGIYVAGGGMEGAIAALREERGPGDVALIVNEWTPDTRAALEDGYVSLVIGTPLRALCDRLMRAICAGLRDDAAPPPGQIFLEPRLYLPQFF